MSTKVTEVFPLSFTGPGSGSATNMLIDQSSGFDMS